MVARHETRYADSPGGPVAYQVIGDGGLELIVQHQPYWPIDLMWEEPALARFLDRLSAFCRHVWFDPRGRGASQPLSPGENRIAETVSEDIVAVLDALGWQRAALLALGTAVPLMAATHPHRVSALVLVDASAGRLYDSPEYPPELVSRVMAERYERWGTESLTDLLAPSMAGDGQFRSWLARATRLTCSPEVAMSRALSLVEADLRPILPSIRVPTMVVARRGYAATRFIADHIEAATFQELKSDDSILFCDRAGELSDAIEEFLTGRLPAHDADRALATVVLTDMVASTETATRIGDRRWRALLDAHDAMVRHQLERFRGREIKTTGDGFLATFDGPARAIQCGCAIRDAARQLGVEVRVGVHTGEVELRGDDIGGITVHIGQRVSSLAQPGEVLVSRTVADLLAGSSIAFSDRGEYELKGLSGAWRLFAAETS